ncbi:MAG: hypothetical protein JWM43_2193 [Acidobacteriaceae bacterium]|nr:hypothetical protein [Acidobacteriaceae bacterium]
MQYRGRIIHSDSVRALNNIDTVYYDALNVRAKFIVLLNFLETDEMKEKPVSVRTSARLDDLITELLSEMCKNLGFDFDHTQIKTKAYRPEAYDNEERYTAEVRSALMPILTGQAPLHIKSDD